MKKKYFLTLLYINLLFLSLFTQSQNAPLIPLYIISTPSHEIMKNEWFLPSLKEEFDIHEFSHEQTCQNAHFMNNGWKKTTLAKVDMIIQAIEENRGNYFLYSDVDIQFFRPVSNFLLNYIENYDIVIQKDNPDGVMCTGFFFCRANEKMLQIWHEVKYIMQTTKHSDQAAFNIAIKKFGPRLNIQCKLLPTTFMSGGTLTGKTWHPGTNLTVPKDLYIHHANWTVGVENKIKQLIYVKNKIESYNQKKS